MLGRRQSKTPEELRLAEQRLRRERPYADPEVLDRIEADVVARAGLTRTAGTPRRTRVAIVGLLVGGTLLSGAGASLAITGPSLSGSAGQAQYAPPPSGTTPTTTGGDVLGEPPATGTVPPPTTPPDTTPPTTPPDTTTPDTTDATGTVPGDTGGVLTVVDPGGQAEATSRTDELPFTGLAAIPIILAGLVLMAAGLVLRRSADRR